MAIWRWRPVFVVGFPRSRTTLLEQMLDAHPDFRSMDERTYIHDLIEGMALVDQSYPADLASLSQQDADQLREVYHRQVRKVLPDLGGHRKAVGRWQNYRDQFDPVLTVLQPWIDRLGYSQ